VSVVVIATIVPAEGKSEAVKQVFLEIIPDVHAEPGCELYALHEDGAGLVMVEKWAGPEALEAHAAGATLARATAALGDLLAGPPEVRTFTALPAGDPAKGAL
jgi:quinol monooxygenase YgiN